MIDRATTVRPTNIEPTRPLTSMVGIGFGDPRLSVQGQAGGHQECGDKSGSGTCEEQGD